MKFSPLFSAFFIALTLTLNVSATVHYVNIGNSGPSAPYTSWNTASTNVQTALNACGAGDEVWVAAGLYFENLTLPNDVTLLGGFSGTETTSTQRDWRNRSTVLDGRGMDSVIVIAPGATNRWATRVDGITIRNGRADSGGGIRCDLSSGSILNDTIIQNEATFGAGIECNQSSLLVQSNVIQNNYAIMAGGGIFSGQSSVTIRNNAIIRNTAVDPTNQYSTFGGAMWISEAAPEITGNLILGNVVSEDLAMGSGIFIARTGSGSIRNNTIVWNQAQLGSSTLAGGICCQFNTNLLIANNIIAFGPVGLYANAEQGLQFSNNCVFGNHGRDFVNITNQSGVSGNISADPLFVTDSRFPEFHISAGSPCRDAGISELVIPGESDLYGGARIVGNAVDIGAVEFGNPVQQFVPTIIRVSPAGNDINEGLTWITAKRTVQAGIDAVESTGGEVWVRAGTYAENLELGFATHLYGGFFGSESNRLQRDLEANVTVLDGNQATSVIVVSNQLQWNVIDGFTIRNGHANSGGGIDCIDSMPLIANNCIVQNFATNGGGISFSTRSTMPLGPGVVTNSTISSNSAALGGGIHASLNNDVRTALTLVHNRLQGNSCGQFYVQSLGNGRGGAIYIGSSTAVSVVDNLLLDNTATNAPVAGTTGYGPAGRGGGIYSASPTLIANNTFIRNTALASTRDLPDYGGGIYLTSTSTIANNLVAFGSTGIYYSSPANIRNNCVFGNMMDYVSGSLTGTNGNISVDPLLVSSVDYRLSSQSPCVNAGNNADEISGLDYAKNPRISGGTVDIGAYEFQNPASIISYAWLQQYGLPFDGSADTADPDGDRLNNWQEWRAGTSPIDSASVLKMLTLTNDISGTTVSWQSVSGINYVLERSDLISGAGFSTIQTNIAGQAGSTSFTDTNAIGARKMVYRVGVQ